MGRLRIPALLACVLGAAFAGLSWWLVFGGAASPLLVTWLNWLPILAGITVFGSSTGPSQAGFLIVAFAQYAIVVFAVSLAIASLLRRR